MTPPPERNTGPTKIARQQFCAVSAIRPEAEYKGENATAMYLSPLSSGEWNLVSIAELQLKLLCPG